MAGVALERAVREALAGVRDPEIPPLSIADLGMVERVAVADDRVEVDLLPTFSGCPALDAIHEDVSEAVRRVAAGRPVTVRFVHSPPWTTERITPEGRRALREHGIAPPGPHVAGEPAFVPLASLSRSGGQTCPFCGGADAVLESAFGATLCRTTWFCRSCRNPFEAFKPKV